MAPQADVDVAAALCDWIMKDDWKESRAPRAAFVAYEAATSRHSDHPLLFQAAKEKGVEWTPHVFYPFTATDYSMEVRKLIDDQKCDYVYMRGPPANNGMLLKDAARLGLKDKAKWVLCNFSLEPCVGEIAGLDVIPGTLGSCAHGTVETNDAAPAVAEIKALHDKYHPDIPFANMYLWGNRMAVTADAVIMTTLERVGLEGLTGTEFAESMWDVKDLDFNGNGMPLTMEQGNIAVDHYIQVVEWGTDGLPHIISDYTRCPWLIGNPEVNWRK